MNQPKQKEDCDRSLCNHCRHRQTGYGYWPAPKEKSEKRLAVAFLPTPEEVDSRTLQGVLARWLASSTVPPDDIELVPAIRCALRSPTVADIRDCLLRHNVQAWIPARIVSVGWRVFTALAKSTDTKLTELTIGDIFIEPRNSTKQPEEVTNQ